MKKEVKRFGNSLVVVFNVEDARIYNIKEGDIIDMGDILIIKRRKKTQ